MAGNVSIREIAQALDVTAFGARQRAKRECWPFHMNGKARAYPLETLPLPVLASVMALRKQQAEYAAEQALAAQPENVKRAEAAWEVYKWAKGWQKRVAERRQEALIAVATLRAQGVSLNKTRQRVAADLKGNGMAGASVPALKRWGRAVAGIPRKHWLAFLLPGMKFGRPCVEIHPEALAVFRRDYLRLEQPDAASCYQRLERQSASFPAWHPLPDLKTLLRRVERETSAGVRILARGGEKALELTAPPMTRDRSGLTALQQVNADGHQIDVFVRHPDGSIFRPVLVGWQDNYSSKLLAWRWGRSETAELVRLSFCDVVEKYGIPDHAYLDNGRAFASKKNTGGLLNRYRFKVKEEDPQGVITRCGTKVHWVTPYNGKAKQIERFWRDIATCVAKHPAFAGAYVGNSPGNKPENYASHAVPLDVFLAIADECIRELNARSGRRAAVCAGRSFDQTFSDSYATATITKASTTQLAMMLLASDVAKVSSTHGHVSLAGNRYWSEALCKYMGQKVELRFDPDALHGVVHVFSLGGDYLCQAECNAAVGFDNNADANEALRTKRAYMKKFRELTKAEKARDAAATPRAIPPIPEYKNPAAGVTKLYFPKRQTHANPVAADIEGPTEGERMASNIIQIGRNPV